MSRDQRMPASRASAQGRTEPGGAAVVPEPPESSFWLERTPLPIPRQALMGGDLGRSPLAPPSTVCPKCDSPLSPSEVACPSCGLRRVMFGRFRTSSMERVPHTLEKLWRQLEGEWASPELHERFLAQVSLCGAYAYAASRYRKAARQRQSDAIANLQLERLSRMVHAVMAVSAVRAEGERDGRPYRGVVILLVLLVGLGGAALLYLFHRGGPSEQIERVPPSIKVRRGRNAAADGRPAPAFGGLRATAPNRADAGADEEADESEAGDRAEEGSGDEE
jgi:hypothetical protein